MESGSRSSWGFDEVDADDDESGKREGTSRKRELSVKVDGRRGGNDQRGATPPRLKHSATEQRRRSKINDRFQILRELIPNNDQKRDKASFLLEVIEYIQFLQEKVQKYESSSYPGFGEENAKLMPWNTSQVPGDCTIDPTQVIRNGSSPGFIYPSDDNGMPPATGVLSTAHNPIDSDMSAGVSYKSLENRVCLANKAVVASVPQRLITHIDNLASHSQSQWLRASDYSVSSDVISEQEELTIDKGTISVSAAYSENILNTLNQALVSSGIDLSQANVSVQINLGKRAAGRAAIATTMSSAKDHDDPSSGNRPVIINSRAGSSGEESEQAPKRRKSDNSSPFCCILQPSRLLKTHRG